MRTREQIVDEMLVLAAQAGRADALAELARRWHPRLLRAAWRLTRDVDGAHESVQEAWLAIARGLGRLDDPARFGAWVLTIVRRRCADWIRTRRRWRSRESAIPEGSTEKPATTLPQDARARAREALGRLDPDRRALLALFYLEGFSIEEIAGTLGIPPGTVKSRLFHARERLRAVLEV